VKEEKNEQGKAETGFTLAKVAGIDWDHGQTSVNRTKPGPSFQV